ncbi:hypothetical protein AB1N83_014085 [Pleurotus pulmonarius]
MFRGHSDMPRLQKHNTLSTFCWLARPSHSPKTRQNDAVLLATPCLPVKQRYTALHGDTTYRRRSVGTFPLFLRFPKGEITMYQRHFARDSPPDLSRPVAPS